MIQPAVSELWFESVRSGWCFSGWLNRVTTDVDQDGEEQLKLTQELNVDWGGSPERGASIPQEWGGCQAKWNRLTEERLHQSAGVPLVSEHAYSNSLGVEGKLKWQEQTSANVINKPRQHAERWLTYSLPCRCPSMLLVASLSDNQ